MQQDPCGLTSPPTLPPQRGREQTEFTPRADSTSRLSVDFRLGDLPLAGEEIEVAAFVGLPDMGGEHGPIAAKVAWRRLFPRRAAAGEFLLRDVQVDAPRRHVALDRVAGLNE